MSARERGTPRGALRWLLRLLAEPTIARELCERDAPDAMMPLRSVLEMAPADREHRDDDRVIARDVLQNCLDNEPAGLPAQYLRLVTHLMSRDEDRASLVELSRFCGLPEIFDDPAALPGQPESAAGFIETHCHFRGGVPFDALWDAWRSDRRFRGRLKRRHGRSDDECHLTHRHDAESPTWGGLLDLCFRTDVPDELAARLSTPGSTLEDLTLEDIIRCLEPLPRDPRAQLALARYLAVCAGLRVYFIHQRGVDGLDHFVRSFERYSKAQRRRSPAGRVGSDEHLARAIFDRYHREGVAGLEFRPTLDSSARALRGKLRRVINAYEAWRGENPDRTLRLGFVPSLFKQEGWRRHPEFSPADQQHVWTNQTRILLGLLESDPRLRYYIVGLDAAGSEQGIPPRLFAPAVALVHAYNRRHGVGHLPPGRVAEPPSPEQTWPFRLGLTMHAGEDFVDPVTGLRHIWEALTHLDLRDGDRLGHALAAGLEGELGERDSPLHDLMHRRANTGVAWVRRDARGLRVAKPVGVHALDLAWQIERLPDQQAELRPQLAATLGHAYAATGLAHRASPDAALVGLTLRLPAAHFRKPDDIPADHRTWVPLDAGWSKRFGRLRTLVCNEIRRRAVVVESCPTSNIAVAGLRTHLVHHFHRAGLRVTVATDDPGVFGVYPAAELARLGDDSGDPGRLTPEAAIEASRQVGFVRAPEPSLQTD